MELTIIGATIDEQEDYIVSEIYPLYNQYEKALTKYPTNKFINYFMLKERMYVIGRRFNCNFFDFVASCMNSCSSRLGAETQNSYEIIEKPYIQQALEYHKSKGKSTLKSLYQIYSMYGSSNSIFPIETAKLIYSHYKANCILDPFCGWGSRMIASCETNKISYIGIDKNIHLENPYKEMIKAIQQINPQMETKIKIMFKDAVNVDYSQLNYDMVFTSPPYYNLELYRNTERKTPHEWDINVYIPIFTNTYKYLQANGWYILNVPIKIYERICVPLFGEAIEKIEMQSTKFRQIKNIKKGYKEYIYVWQKPICVFL